MTMEARDIQVVCKNCGKVYNIGRDKIGKRGKCACGAVFEIVEAEPMGFAEEPASPADALSRPAGSGGQGEPGARCHNHPAVAATKKCLRCWTPICDLCMRGNPAAPICPACFEGLVSGRAPAALATVPSHAPPALAEWSAGVNAQCRAHPDVQAVRFCANCHAPVCATCDFALPNGIHLCATCATTPQTKLTSKRKSTLAIAIALASWSTVGFVVILSGALANLQFRNEQEAAMILGVVLTYLVGIPCLIAGALGLSCLDKRQGNPAIVWVTAIWSEALQAAWVMLSLFGVLSLL